MTNSLRTQNRNRTKGSPFLFFVVKLLVLPFRFVWLLVIRSRLRRQARKDAMKGSDA